MLKRVLMLAAVAGTAAAVAWWQVRARGGAPTPPNAVAPEPRAILGVGHVEPASEVRRLMLRAGGVIRRVHCRPGQRVYQGDLLLELEDATQRADVTLARRQVETARAEAAHVGAGVHPHRLRAAEHAAERLREQLEHLRSEAARLRPLRASRAVSDQEAAALEARRRQTEAALKEQQAELRHLRDHVTPEHRARLAAQVLEARARLGQAEERLRETRLVAPFDGTVLKLLKREGEGVRTFEPEPVMLFGDLSRLRVRAEIDERFVRQLRVGQPAEVHGRNLAGRSYRGKVVEVEPVMGGKTAFTHAAAERKDLEVVQVLVELGPDFQAPVGLRVDVRIE